MDRNEKLCLSADAVYCHCFKQGMFARFFEQSLYWFVHTVKPLKPMLERVKGGEPVLYGGLPISSFEKLLAENRLNEVEATQYGWKWAYAKQKQIPDDSPEFASWRAEVWDAAPGAGKPGNGGRDVLSEIADFDLAAHTPMQAMNAIAEWQEALRD